MTRRFKFSRVGLDNVTLVERLVFKDTRGKFSRLFCEQEFRELGFDNGIAQINLSFSMMRGSVRGMHFQNAPHSEQKVVYCLSGEIFDVAVDARVDSPTYLNWYGQTLSASNGLGLFIPEGFAHGFQTLTDDCELLYFHSTEYVPDSERGIHYADPSVGVEWPLEVTSVSDKDASRKMIKGVKR